MLVHRFGRPGVWIHPRLFRKMADIFGGIISKSFGRITGKVDNHDDTPVSQQLGGTVLQGSSRIEIPDAGAEGVMRRIIG